MRRAATALLLLLALLFTRSSAAQGGSEKSGALLPAEASTPAAGPARPSIPLPPAITDSDYRDNGQPDPEMVELGKLLFYDKILSGNRNISCATCHHGLTDTGDGLSLPVGEGGAGLGVIRHPGSLGRGIHQRVPRNAPPVFNLGALEFEVMFHDGRVEVDESQPSGFRSPAGDDLPLELDSVLAAQAMFPVTSGDEMAGQPGENAVADAAAAGDLPLVWDLLATRVQAIEEYVDLFSAAFDDVTHAKSITFRHVANAIAAFEGSAWRADGSPFDAYLRGDASALSAQEQQGMNLFYDKAGCAFCHSGSFQTDHAFHAIAMPQIGPGKGDGESGLEDFGRERVTGLAQDRFRFRTPSLRNVALTGPWGHDGAYNSLRAIVDHNIDPIEALIYYDTSQAVLPSRWDLDALDFVVQSDINLVLAIAQANEIPPKNLTAEEVEALIAFLRALTDPASLDLRDDVPLEVPSGIPVAETPADPWPPLPAGHLSADGVGGR